MSTKEQSGDRPDPEPGWPRTNVRKMVKKKCGKLRVKHETEARAANGAIIWFCQCKCGGTALVATHNLTSGNTQSCGCVQIEQSKKANRKSGARWNKNAKTRNK